MAGKTMDISDLLLPDSMGTQIAEKFLSWNNSRQNWISQKRELREYIYATDTSTTSAGTLPWSNKTTLPKLTQIRDNLFANYLATMFPKRRWLAWEGDTKDDETRAKTRAIKDYMTWVVNQRQFKEEIRKMVLDFIDYGNAFGTVEWVDETQEMKNSKIKTGYVGPRIVRISPIDIVMNPTAPSFGDSPKIVRQMVTRGEVAEILNQFTLSEDEKERAESILEYMKTIRSEIGNGYSMELTEKDHFYQIDGFDSFRSYLGSNYCELLHFTGDIYDEDTGEFQKNVHVIIVDRHKVLYHKPHWYPLSEIPIYHAPWRVRQDNLWAMGPLDNLVGMQYRLDHIENMKADIFDLTAYPPLKIKGMVNDFTWGPFEKIYVDSDGDVELMSPNVQALQANFEIQAIEARMEEMAGSPREAMGFRTPGEKTAYEVQRMENAASRIFQNKIGQFEEQIVEPLLNACLVMAQQHLTDVTVRVLEDEFRSSTFRTITRQSISANGQIKPVAARRFAEKAEKIQNLTNFYGSAIGQDPEVRAHFSSVKTAKMIEDLLDIEEYELVEPYVRLNEQAEAQQLSNTQQEEVMATAEAPSGLSPDDFSQL